MSTFKLPEPTHTNPAGKPFYTEAQLKQTLKDVLDQAAKRCDLVGCWPSLGPKHCAESIREMIGEI